MCDISVKIENKKFNFRVAVLLYSQDKVLIQKVHKEDYLSLIGGRVKLGEDTKSAAERELKEELNLKIDSKLLELYAVCENFFTYNEKDFHEILFMYKYHIKTDNFEPIKVKDKDETEAIWVKIDDLKNLNLKPEFVKDFRSNAAFRHVLIK